jgi:hypothetical protein
VALSLRKFNLHHLAELRLLLRRPRGVHFITCVDEAGTPVPVLAAFTSDQRCIDVCPLGRGTEGLELELHEKLWQRIETEDPLPACATVRGPRPGVVERFVAIFRRRPA